VFAEAGLNGAYSGRMAAVDAYELRGGSHNEERSRLSPAAPNSLFAITTDDGERFARTKERMRDNAGILWTIFRFDADGRATARACERFCGAE
jgi:hypothetical protein